MHDFRFVLWALALLLPGWAAHAQERRVLVRYDVAIGCPEVGEFSSKLTQRTGPLRLELSGAATPDLDVTVRQTARSCAAASSRTTHVPASPASAPR